MNRGLADPFDRHTLSSNSEDYWLTTGWRTLRGQILELAWSASGLLFQKIELSTPVSVDHTTRYERQLYSEMERRARASALWAEALRLFPLPVDLVALIASQASVLREEGPVSRAAAFKTMLHTPLEEARRTLLPGSVQRRKNWETIDRVSRKIFDINQPQEQRCSIEHARDVAAELCRRYPASKNLRLSAASVQAYFEDFLPACSPVFEHEDPGLLPAAFEEDREDAELMRRLDLASVDLDDCVARLDGIKRELVHTVYRLGPGGKVAWATAQAFRQGHGLSRHAFEALHRETLLELGNCLSWKTGQDNDG